VGKRVSLRLPHQLRRRSGGARLARGACASLQLRAARDPLTRQLRRHLCCDESGGRRPRRPRGGGAACRAAACAPRLLPLRVLYAPFHRALCRRRRTRALILTRLN
jgi:hypothetical protein